jgi:hypothetical protein
LSIRTYTPQVKVALLKNIRRDEAGVSKRYTGARTTVDLTPFLGENGAVTTHKSIMAPMGQFQITLTDQRDGQTQDTLYAMAEPMDSIEIRMAREPHKTPGELPIVMRGFVTQVRRSETMGPNGRPQRQVTISGADYGLAFARVRLTWLQAAGTGAALSNFARLQAVGLAFQAWPASDFVRDVVSFVVNPWLDEFFAQSVGNSGAESMAPAARSLSVDATVAEGTVNPYGVQPFDRPVWEWLAEHCDLAWNELFVEDRPEGPALVYRAMPFRDISGHWIPQGASKVEAGTIDVKDDAIVSVDVSRSDSNVANVYWASPAAIAYVPDASLKAAAFNDGTVIETSKNSAIELYGSRLMSVTLAQGPTGLGRPSGLPADKQQEYAVSFDAWALLRRQSLMAFNRDNVAFEDVSMTLRGDEGIRPGNYIRVNRGGFMFEFYAQAVSHEFRPFQTFTTSVQGIRGTGLIERSKMPASPYATEGRAGAYG